MPVWKSPLLPLRSTWFVISVAAWFATLMAGADKCLAQTAKPDAAKPAAAAPAAAAPADAAAAPAAEPQYDVLTPDEKLKKNSMDVKALLRAGSVPDNRTEFFDSYYKNYFFPRWTQPENRGKLIDFRHKDLHVDLTAVRTAPGYAAHDRLVGLTVEFMTKLINGNYHPVVRVNAALCLGDLNQKEPAPTEDPVPLPQSVPLLLKAAQDPKQIDPVRVAALVGLERHARLGIANEDVRKEVVAAMAKLVVEASPQPGRSADGHAWARQQAAEVLGLLKNPGEKNAAAEALTQVVGSAETPLPVRRAAVRALGRLNYQSGSPANAAAMMSALGRMAVAACQAAKTEQGEEKPAPDRVLRSMLLAVKLGLKGPDDKSGVASAAKDPAQQQAVKPIQDKLVQLTALLDERDLAGASFVDKAAAAAEQLSGLVEKKP